MIQFLFIDPYNTIYKYNYRKYRLKRKIDEESLKPANSFLEKFLRYNFFVLQHSDLLIISTYYMGYVNGGYNFHFQIHGDNKISNNYKIKALNLEVCPVDKQIS